MNLSELQPGDAVFVKFTYMEEPLRIEYVVRRTPTGIIKTSRARDGKATSAYRPDGYAQNYERWGPYIVPADRRKEQK